MIELQVKWTNFHPVQKKFMLILNLSSIGKNIKVDLAIVSDVTDLLKSLIKRFKEKNKKFANSNKQKTSKWWEQIAKWRDKKSLNFINSNKVIKPQHAVKDFMN